MPVGNFMKLKTFFKTVKKDFENKWNNVMYKNPEVAKGICLIGMTPMLFVPNMAMASFKDAVTKMIDIVSSLFMGVGIVYALIAVFNWVSAIKQEDAERQSKAITNIFVAGLLILIKPITSAIIVALAPDQAGQFGFSDTTDTW